MYLKYAFQSSQTPEKQPYCSDSGYLGQQVVEVFLFVSCPGIMFYKLAKMSPRQSSFPRKGHETRGWGVPV